MATQHKWCIVAWLLYWAQSGVNQFRSAGQRIADRQGSGLPTSLGHPPPDQVLQDCVVGWPVNMGNAHLLLWVG